MTRNLNQVCIKLPLAWKRISSLCGRVSVGRIIWEREGDDNEVITSSLSFNKERGKELIEAIYTPEQKLKINICNTEILILYLSLIIVFAMLGFPTVYIFYFGTNIK